MKKQNKNKKEKLVPLFLPVSVCATIRDTSKFSLLFPTVGSDLLYITNAFGLFLPS